jgi:hypothetical protein
MKNFFDLAATWNARHQHKPSASERDNNLSPVH